MYTGFNTCVCVGELRRHRLINHTILRVRKVAKEKEDFVGTEGITNI